MMTVAYRVLGPDRPRLCERHPCVPYRLMPRGAPVPQRAGALRDFRADCCDDAGGRFRQGQGSRGGCGGGTYCFRAANGQTAAVLPFSEL